MNSGNYTLLAPVSFTIFIVMTVLSVTTSSNWDPTWNNLSDLGASPDLMTACLFNGGCIIAGLLLVLFGGTMYYDVPKYSKGGVWFVIGGIGLTMVGLTNTMFQPWHDVDCAVLMVGAGMGMLLTTLSARDDAVLLFSGFVLLLFLVIQWPFFAGAISEFMPIVVSALWSLIFSWRRSTEGARV